MKFIWFVFLVAFLMPLSACAAEQEDVSVPCSKRYGVMQGYGLTQMPEGKSWQWREGLADWGIERQWGLKDRSSVVPAPGGGLALEVDFPKHSVNPGNDLAPRGGVGAFATAVFEGQPDAACLEYQVYFPKGFEFVKGGKLPGLYGGTKEESGCRADAGEDGFSTRYMWRVEGLGTLYAYIPDKEERCGKLIGFGNWVFVPGQWMTLTQEVVLNTPGKEDGVMRVWVDGALVIEEAEATVRTSKDIHIDGVYFSSFFGGDDASWASPKDQSVYFKGVRVGVR